MTNALGAKPAVDTSEFKARLKEMNADLRVLESGFRASTASMGDWAATGTGLEARIKSLNTQMDVQRGKVSLLRSEYERVKAEKGDDAIATKNAEVAYNKAAETLGKMQSELNQTEAALVSVRTDTDTAGREFQDLENKTEQAGNAVKGTGSKLLDFSIIMTGVNSMVQLGRQAFYMLQAAVRGVADIVSSLVGPASNLNETISKTNVVFGDAAGEVLTFGKNAAGALGLSENAALAAAGTYGNLFRAFGTSEEASADMSMSLVTLAADLASFNNMDPTEVLDKLRAGLTGESEPLKTLGIAMNEARLEAKALELGLIEVGEPLDANAKAQAAYAIMMEDTALAQGDFARTSDGLANQQRILAAQFENTKATLGGLLMPAVLSGVTVLSGYLERFAGIVDTFADKGGGIANLKAGLVGLVTDIAGDIASSLPQMLGTGLMILQTILQGIQTALPKLLSAATSILTSLVEFVVAALPMIIPMGMQVLMTLIEAILANLPMLIEAGLQAIIQLALGLAQALPTLIPTIVETIITIVNVLIENIPMLIDAALQLILGLAQGLVAAIPVLIPAIPQILQAIITALIAALPMIGEAAVQLVMALLTGIIGALPSIGKAAGEIVVTLVKGVNDLQKTLLKVGTDIVEGVWQGIKSQAASFYKKIQDFFKELIKAVMEELQEESPSKVFFRIGANVVKGFGLGFGDEFQKMQQQFSQSFGSLAFSPAFTSAGGSSGGNYDYSTNNNSSISIGGIQIPGAGPNTTIADIMEFLNRRG